METVNVTMNVPKEGKEIVDLLDAILEKVLSKAELAEYANLFGTASVAVDGVNKVVDEIKSEYRDELAGYLVQKLMARLLAPKAQ